MDQVIKIVSGMIQENTYLIGDEDGCYIIDPGYGAKRIIKMVEEHFHQVKAILLTHGHFDHVGAVDELVMTYHCPVYLHPADATFVKEIKGPGESLGYRTILQAELLNPETIPDKNIIFLHTPGHSPGSGCYLFQDSKNLFSGDTLFSVDIGRVDLPGGSWKEMQASLRLLKTLPDNLVLHPGHEEQSTLGKEKATNQYLSRV